MAIGVTAITDRTFKNFSYAKRNVEDELKEILIIRDDGSRILIQEIISDLEKLKKIKIVEKDEKDKAIKEYYAYTEGLDFDNMHGKSRYIDWIGEGLLSRERLNEKERISREYGLSDIYVGFITVDLKGKYSMYSLDDKKILPRIAREKREKAHNKENEEKNKLLNRIYNRLEDADNNQLKNILAILERNRGERGY